MAVRVPFRLRKLAWLVSVTLAATGTAAAAPAGRVDFAIGGVTVTGTDGRSRPAAKGLDLQSGDRIVTTDGRAQIRFTDGAYVSVQPNSDFSIREYQFDGKTDGKEKGIFGLVRGALRTVTGAIGRVNRGTYQIQTPTATIGIRGTGGLIQVLPDGSTLVTGNSGVWSLSNQAGSVDVPAGKAAKAGPNQTLPPTESVEGPVLPPPQGVLESPLWPTESDRLTAIPTSAPNAAQLFVPGPGTVFVAGNNVTSSGLPASLFPTSATSVPPPLTSGTYDAYTAQSLGVFSLSNPLPGTSVTFGASGDATTIGPNMLGGGGTVVEFGNVSPVAWGRWIGNGITLSYPPGPQTFTSNQGLHYVIGIPTPTLPTTGVVPFTFLAATSPTLNDGSLAPGTYSGQMTVDFGTAMVGTQFNLGFSSFSYAVSTPGGVAAPSVPITAGAKFSTPSASVVPSGTAPAICSTGCSMTIQGGLFGVGASVGAYTFQGGGVSGAAVFKQ